MFQTYDGAGSAPWRPLVDRSILSGPQRRARSFERKRYRPEWVRSLELISPLRFFFTGGIEYDERIDPVRLTRFVDDFRIFVTRLGVLPLWGAAVELKFRKLGRHRADGLYYPDCKVMVMALRSAKSFAHEFGHLVDFRANRDRLPGFLTSTISSREEFRPFHEALLERMRRDGRGDPRLSRSRGRCSWRYFASGPECFARAFEQWAANFLPSPSALVGTPERYQSDVLYYREFPEELAAFFGRLLAVGPEQ